MMTRIVLLVLLGSLGCQGAAIIGSPLAKQLKDHQFSIERPSVKDQQFPNFQGNKTASMRILNANSTTRPASSSTIRPYSAPTTAAPHAAAPTPASYPRPLIPTDASASYALKPILLTPIAPIIPDFYPRPLIPMNTFQPAPYAAPTAPASYSVRPLPQRMEPYNSDFYPGPPNPTNNYQPAPYAAPYAAQPVLGPTPDFYPIPLTPMNTYQSAPYAAATAPASNSVQPRRMEPINSDFYPRPPNPTNNYQPAPYAAPHAAQPLLAPPTTNFYPIPLNPMNTNQPAPRAAPTAPASDDIDRPLMVDLSISFPKSSGFRNLTAYLHCSDDCISYKSWLPALFDWMQ